MKKQKIKYMIVRNSFDFFVNYNGSTIYSACKKLKIKNTANMYDTFDIMRDCRIVDNHGKLTEKGWELQQEMIRLNEILKYIK